MNYKHKTKLIRVALRIDMFLRFIYTIIMACMNIYVHIYMALLLYICHVNSQSDVD